MPKSKQPIPEGLRTVTPQLVVKDALRLVDFRKTAFGATGERMMWQVATHVEDVSEEEMKKRAMSAGPPR